MSDQRQPRDAVFAALLDAKCAGVPVGKINELVASAYDLNDAPVGPLMPNATDAQVNAKMIALGHCKNGEPWLVTVLARDLVAFAGAVVDEGDE